MRTVWMTSLVATAGLGMALTACGGGMETGTHPAWSQAEYGVEHGAPVRAQLIRFGEPGGGRIEQVIGDEHFQQLLDGAG
jgi:hypothetical protein